MQRRYVILFCALLGAGAGALLAQQKGTSEPKPLPWELAKDRVEAARKTFETVQLEFRDGKATLDQLRDWSNRWVQAQQEVSTKKADRLAALEAHVARMKIVEKLALERFQAQRGLNSDISAAEYWRVDSELRLARERTSK